MYIQSASPDRMIIEKLHYDLLLQIPIIRINSVTIKYTYLAVLHFEISSIGWRGEGIRHQ